MVMRPIYINNVLADTPRRIRVGSAVWTHAGIAKVVDISAYLDTLSQVATCVAIGRHGELLRFRIKIKRLKSLDEAFGPQTCWPEAGDLRGSEFEQEEREAKAKRAERIRRVKEAKRNALKLSKKAARKVRSNKIKRLAEPV